MVKQKFEIKRLKSESLIYKTTKHFYGNLLDLLLTKKKISRKLKHSFDLFSFT